MIGASFRISRLYRSPGENKDYTFTEVSVIQQPSFEFEKVFFRAIILNTSPYR